MTVESEFFETQEHYEIARSLNKLRAKVLNAIETLGLDERQEDAFKRNFKSISYDTESELRERLENMD